MALSGNQVVAFGLYGGTSLRHGDLAVKSFVDQVGDGDPTAAFSLYGGIGPRHGSFAGKSSEPVSIFVLTASGHLLPLVSAIPTLKVLLGSKPSLKPR